MSPDARELSVVLRYLADELTGFVDQAVRDGSSFDQFERSLWRQDLTMGHTVAQFFVKMQGNGDLGENVVTEEQAVLYRSENVATRTLRTIFGEVSFRKLRLFTRPQTKD